MEKYDMKWKNYYEILQVNTNAEPSVIEVVYKRLVRTYHPDVAKGKQHKKRIARMRDINEAYEVLSNAVRRAKYDKLFRAKYPSEPKYAYEPSPGNQSEYKKNDVGKHTDLKTREATPKYDRSPRHTTTLDIWVTILTILSILSVPMMVLYQIFAAVCLVFLVAAIAVESLRTDGRGTSSSIIRQDKARDSTK